MVRFISAKVAATLGADFSLPADGGRDLVVHTSAISAGLQQSLDLLAPGGHGLDLSWYGDADVRLSLGVLSIPAASVSGQARLGRFRRLDGP
jgi:hypothetical protein